MRARAIRIGVLALVIAGGLAGAAQEKPLPEFRLVHRSEAELNSAAELGYRIVTRTSCLLMQKVATPPDVYRYRVVRADLKWHPDRVEQSLNAAGEQGYRLLPASVIFVAAGELKQLFSFDMGVVGQDEFVLEKGPQSHHYTYKLLRDRSSMFGSSSGQIKSDTGFELVGLEISSNSGAYLIYERDNDSQVKPSGGAYKVVGKFRISAMENELNKLAAEGYRVLDAPFWSTVGGGIDVLVRTSAVPASAQYAMLPYKDHDETLRRMKEAADRGFRLLPFSRGKGAVLEKAGDVSRVEVRFIEGDDPDLAAKTQAAVAEGFSVAEFLRTTLVLQKAVPASAQPTSGDSSLR